MKVFESSNHKEKIEIFAMGYSPVIILTVLLSFKLGNAIRVVHVPEVTPTPLVHGDFPWNLKLINYHDDGGRGFCGASLISNEFALTAAHCVMDDPMERGHWTIITST